MDESPLLTTPPELFDIFLQRLSDVDKLALKWTCQECFRRVVVVVDHQLLERAAIDVNCAMFDTIYSIVPTSPSYQYILENNGWYVITHNPVDLFTANASVEILRLYKCKISKSALNIAIKANRVELLSKIVKWTNYSTNGSHVQIVENALSTGNINMVNKLHLLGFIPCDFSFDRYSIFRLYVSNYTIVCCAQSGGVSMFSWMITMCNWCPSAEFIADLCSAEIAAAACLHEGVSTIEMVKAAVLHNRDDILDYLQTSGLVSADAVIDAIEEKNNGG